MEATQVLEQVICFSLEEISLWGARKKLRAEDVPLGAGGTLPPKDLASLGSKKIFNPKVLNTFGTLKKQAHSACAKVGIKFMGGYAVPASKADALAVMLDAIGTKFDKAKNDFVANYEAELAQWVQKHPGWESWIRSATIPIAEVKDKFRYGWTPAKISTPNADDPDNRLNQKMSKEAGGLAGRLFVEIAEMSDKVRENSLFGKDKVNRRVLSSVKAIRTKLAGLAFLDKRVKPLIKAIDDVVAQMPGDAPIEGVQLSALYGLMLTMSDPDKLREFGQAMMDGSKRSETAETGESISDDAGAENLLADIQVGQHIEPEAALPELVAIAEVPVQVAEQPPVKAVAPKQVVVPDLFAGNLFDGLDMDAPVAAATAEAEKSKQEATPAALAVSETTKEAPMVAVTVKAVKPKQEAEPIAPAVIAAQKANKPTRRACIKF